ncbi:hypothetical protein [Clostridium algidicarnis]|uniref:Uncharacterized protein n=2 Tax=Clostridium algidicarnis TaxID=37659 RepID=A0A2S6G0N2_9CLOT|nr:hypothetical protein [Clostridium algidicarnis]MBB6630403.1 hypothetical protein [Clostridium algidicarnis]MBB6696457.1 hypothetical protein [Clostridium algidicarnis]MBU3194014.1 hypothetical protein [Clostridium algidicarnis]MBU3202914.1 hypothetical protein [Clostridium algidicarnis]MBU3205784.1 hypothetical protein [Clostridium algidicarnis]
MEKFEFYDRFKELQDMKNVVAGEKRIEDMIESKESCLGHRKVGDRNYHIFYLSPSEFAVYYHGGGTDAMYTSESLGDVLNYTNTLEE